MFPLLTYKDRPAHRRLNPRQLAALQTGLAAGNSVRSAARDLVLRYDTCLAAAKEHGWITPRRYTRATDDQTRGIINLVSAGTPVRTAARDIGVSDTIAYRIARDAGVHVRQPGHGVAATARRVEYLRLRLAQLTRHDAAEALGISRRTALDIDRRSRQVTPEHTP